MIDDWERKYLFEHWLYSHPGIKWDKEKYRELMGAFDAGFEMRALSISKLKMIINGEHKIHRLGPRESDNDPPR